MNPWRLLVLVVVVTAVQLGFLGALRPWGVVPNALLGLVVAVGLGGTATAALLVAVASGMALDMTSGVDFGLRTALFCLLAVIAGLTHRAGLDLRGPVVGLVLVASGTVVQTVAILAGLMGVVGHWPLGVLAWRLVLELVLNLSILLALRPLVRWAVRSEGELPALRG